MSRLHDDLLRGERAAEPYRPPATIETGLGTFPDFRLLQEMEQLQVALEVKLEPSRSRVLSFTGAVVGEGATTLALHFALFLAHSAEQHVLLMDADMARSSQSLSDGLEDQPGLAEVLRGEVSPAAVVLGTEEPHLHFMPSGRDMFGHAELAHSPRFAALLSEVGSRYRAVIVDAPPVLPHPEAAIIGAASGGVIFVIHHRRTRREVINKAIQTLRLAKCRVLGTVLNRRVHDIPQFIYQRI